MVWSDILYFTPVILGVGGMILSKVPDMIDAITGDHGQADFERFMVDAGRRGLGYVEATRELDIRTIFAQLRREASDAVAIDIENWAVILEAAVQKCLADNPDHERELKAMMLGLSYGHILYEPEAAMVDSLYAGFRSGGQSVDHLAALRVHR